MAYRAATVLCLASSFLVTPVFAQTDVSHSSHARPEAQISSLPDPTLLYTFQGSTSTSSPYGRPQSTPVRAKDGNFYFIASNPSNYQDSIIQMTPAGVMTPMYTFDANYEVVGQLLQAADGNLYGMADSDDEEVVKATHGTAARASRAPRVSAQDSVPATYVFAFDIAKSTVVATYALDGIDTALGLAPDSAGNLYGFTPGGGDTAQGSIFKLQLPTGNPPAAGVLTTLYSFQCGTDGCNPYSSPLIASDGMLYGMNGNGCDSDDDGAVFSFNLTSNTLNPLGCLGTVNTESPINGFVEGQGGILYAATNEGGSTNRGEVYSLNIADGTLADVFDFGSGANGSTLKGAAYSNFSTDTEGNVYIPSGYGKSGQNGSGVISVLSTTGAMTDVYSFPAYGGNSSVTRKSGQALPDTGTTNTLGAYPTGLNFSQDGNLYAIAERGGADTWGTFLVFPTESAGYEPVISLTPSVSAAYVGQQFSLSWSVTNAFSKSAQACFAFSSDSLFNGAQPPTGTANIIPAHLGTHTYTINCGGIETATAAVTVAQGGIAVTSGGAAVSSGNINLGAVPENSSVPYTITLTNNGYASFPLSISKTGSTSSHFSSATTCGSAIAPAASCNVTFTYAAGASAENDQAFFTIAKQGSVFSPTNSFMFTAHSTAPNVITVSSSGHNFGSVEAGVTETYAFQVYNGTGSAQSLSLSGNTVTGNNGQGSYTTTCAAMLPAGGECSVTFTLASAPPLGSYEYDIKLTPAAAVQPAGTVKLKAAIVSGE